MDIWMLSLSVMVMLVGSTMSRSAIQDGKYFD